MPTTPTTPPAFATDAAYASDGDAWSGDPPRVDPGAAIRAEGFEPGILPAEWLNYIVGLHGDWAAYFRDLLGGASPGSSEWVYPSARSRTTLLSLLDCVPGSANVTFDGAKWVSGVGTTEFLYCPIRVPDGASIVSLHAIVTPGGTEAAMKVGLGKRIWSAAYSVVTPSVADGSAASASAVRQEITYTPGSPYVVAASLDETYIRVTLTDVNDAVEGLYVVWSDPGPRPGRL